MTLVICYIVGCVGAGLLVRRRVGLAVLSLAMAVAGAYVAFSARFM